MLSERATGVFLRLQKAANLRMRPGAYLLLVCYLSIEQRPALAFAAETTPPFVVGPILQM